MGFQIGRTFVLDFGAEGETDLFGAVVKMRSGSVGTIAEFGTCTPEREREILAEHVVEWNLEDDGVPLPIAAESFRLLDPPARDMIYVEWLKATRGLSAPFDRRSVGGTPSPAEDEPGPFILMEAPSDSPPPP